VRDGFLEFFTRGLDRAVPVALVPHGEAEVPSSLPLSDDEAVTIARRAALRLEEELGGEYMFYVANEGGLHVLEVDGELRYLVRCWTVLRSPLGEAWGASGAVQLPERMVEGLAHEEVAAAFPARRRSGGMVASLTAGLETRRTSVATATTHALATQFYGTLGRRARGD
jgi:non-canonical (house-cleaning) NTP pyrophosphatase